MGFYINSIFKLHDVDMPDKADPLLIAGLAASAGADVVLVGWSSQKGNNSDMLIKLVRDAVQADLIVVVSVSESNIEKVVKTRADGVVLVSPEWNGTKTAATVSAGIDSARLAEVNAEYKAAGMTVSAFIEPDITEIKAVAKAALAGVVINCADYARARSDEEAEGSLNRLNDSSIAAGKFGLVAGFGHGLNYRNVGPVAALPYSEELYIGRSIVNRALIVGIDGAIKEMETRIYRSMTRN
jgi:pyridoxine 5-phosphate synthase